MFLYLTIYIQGVLGYSPLEAGLRFLPLSLLSFFVAPIAARAAERLGAGPLMAAGMALVGIGLLSMRGVGPGSEWTELIPGFLLGGAGIGMTNPNIGTVAISVVSQERAGMASGINTTFRQVGIATGVAGLGAVFQGSIDSKISAALPAAPHELSEAIASGGTAAATAAAPPEFTARVAAASDAAFTSALNEILLIAAIIVFAGALAGGLLVRDVEAH
jgi:hypothetical protein